MLSIMTRHVEASRLPLHEQAAVEASIDAEVYALPQTALLSRLLIPLMAKVAKSGRHKHAILRCTTVCLAAERYRRANGRWPATLDELVPGELSGVPLDPYDGEPLRYGKPGGGVVIYSVGPDATDNGGALPETNQFAVDKRGTDIGFHIPDPGRRRQKSSKE
jgi:hypothetical protein